MKKSVLALVTCFCLSTGLRTADAACPVNKPDCGPPYGGGGGGGTPPRKSTTVYEMDYQLMSILYAPPGNKSQSGYEADSTTGTQYKVVTHDTNGVVVKVTTNVTDLTAQWSYDTISGSSHTNTKMEGTKMFVVSQEDALDHLQDQFVLWLNPELTESTQYDGNGKVTSQTQEMKPADGNPIEPYVITAQGLLHPSTLGNADQQMIAAHLTPHDREQIVLQDPFFGYPPCTNIPQCAFYTPPSGVLDDITYLIPTANPTLDPNRFAFVRHMDAVGPLTPGGSIPGTAITNQYAVSSGDTNGTGTSVGGTILVGGEVDFLYKAGVKAGYSLKLSHQDTTTILSGTTQKSTLSAYSSTTCYRAPFDVYYDKAFAVFAYVPDGDTIYNCNQPADISGQVLDPNGKPLMGVEVDITGPDGTQYAAVTNTDGVYRLDGVHSATGMYQIQVIDGENTAAYRPNAPLTVEALHWYPPTVDLPPGLPTHL